MDRDERIFLAALGQANQKLGRYVVRVLEESTGLGVTEYTHPLSDIEHALGLALSDFGRQLVKRAEVRGLVVVDSVAPQAKATGRGVSESSRTMPDVPEVGYGRHDHAD